MPMTVMSNRKRGFLYGIIATLSVLSLALLVGGLILRGQLNHANERLTKIEAREVARDTATAVGEIATCYASARGRPALVTILRGIAAKLDPDPRKATNDFIDQYEENAPTLAECDTKARAHGFTRKDFPYVTREPTGKEQSR